MKEVCQWDERKRYLGPHAPTQHSNLEIRSSDGLGLEKEIRKATLKSQSQWRGESKRKQDQRINNKTSREGSKENGRKQTLRPQSFTFVAFIGKMLCLLSHLLILGI